MKKKFRNIVVEGVQYAWQANQHVDEHACAYIKVKIWKDKVLLKEIDLTDEEDGSVTPRQIEALIKKL